MTHPSSHLIENLSSSRYYLLLHLVSFYTFLDFYLDIVDMLVPWMSLGTRNIRKYKIQSSDISSAGNTRSHAVAAVARCCWLLLAAVGSQLQASKHFRVRKIISELRHGAVARPGAWSCVFSGAVGRHASNVWQYNNIWRRCLLRQVFKRFKPIVCSLGKGSPNP